MATMVQNELVQGQGVKFNYVTLKGKLETWEGFVEQVKTSKEGVRYAVVNVFTEIGIEPRSFHLKRMQLI